MQEIQTEVKPTYYGHIATKTDAEILLGCCLRGLLFHAPRGPYSDGRNVQSETVYIYERNASGITEWNDGKSWDLVREGKYFVFYVETTEKGLRKKTLEIVRNGQHHHLVAYYSEKAKAGPRPSRDSSLIDVRFFFFQLCQTREDVDNRLNDMIEPLSTLAGATTIQEIKETFKNCWDMFSPIPDILKDLGKRATAWAIESLEEDGDEEWDVEPYGAAIWEQYGLAMQLENLHEEIEGCLSQNSDRTTDKLSYNLEYFQRLMKDLRDNCQESTSQLTQDVV